MTAPARISVVERMLIDSTETFFTIERYLGDPAYAARLDAERDRQRDAINARFDAIRDADLIRLGYKDSVR